MLLGYDSVAKIPVGLAKYPPADQVSTSRCDAEGSFPQNENENKIEAQMSIPSVLLLLSFLFQMNGVECLRFNKPRISYRAPLLCAFTLAQLKKLAKLFGSFSNESM